VSVLAPVWLVVAGAGALAVAALHFLARRRPRAAPFPTARFVPDRAASAAAPSARPTDLLLLAMRALAVLLAGAALAGPVRSGDRVPVARIVALDASASVADPAAAAARAAALLRDGDLLVRFDSGARVVAGRAADSLRAAAPAPSAPGAPGSLSAALVAARRAAPRIARRADSVELVLVSPLAAEEWDAATLPLRALWPGRLTIERVAAARPPEGAARAIAPSLDDDDPLSATVALLGTGARAEARVARGALSAADSAWAREAGRVLVHWPADPAAAGWERRARPDTVGAVASGGVVVVAPFARAAEPPAGRAVARWVDGAPAATERALGAGCVRAVAVPVAAAGDLALREPMRALVRRMAEPCGVVRALEPAPDSLVAALAGAGALAPASTLRGPRESRSPATPWLLGAALLLVLAEPLARRGRA
jgi:hypothetical protein